MRTAWETYAAVKPGHPQYVDFANDDWLDADLDSLESWLVEQMAEKNCSKRKQKACALF